jgi:hypothetical protein
MSERARHDGQRPSRGIQNKNATATSPTMTPTEATAARPRASADA